MEKKDVMVSFNGEEKNKSEIIYNNVIKTMASMDMSKDDQIEYLKAKVTNLETDARTKFMVGLFILIGFALQIFGIYLMVKDLELFGTIMILCGFVIPVLKLTLIVRKNWIIKNSKFTEIDRLKSILNSRLK